MAFSRVTGLEDLKDYSGMSRRSPWLALMMLSAFLSLAGMPPFAGFVAKVFVFAAGIQAGYVWLVIIGILNSIIGVYYYLNAMKYVYLYRMPEQDEENHPVPMTRALCDCAGGAHNRCDPDWNGFCAVVQLVGRGGVEFVLDPLFICSSTAEGTEHSV